MVVKRIFKIRNLDGLFSTGGVDPQWSVTGKPWKQLGHVNCHIKLVEGYQPDFYYDCEIVEYELVEVKTRRICND